MSGTAWVVSYVVLWVAVVGLTLTVIVLLRQIGVLHTRVAPMGVHFAGEGPDRGSRAPDAEVHDYAGVPYTLVAFTSPTCELCARLVPQLRTLARQYDDVELRVVSSETHSPTFAAFKVRSTPYLALVDDRAAVRSRGVANTLDQVEEMLAEVLEPSPPTLSGGAS